MKVARFQTDREQESASAEAIAHLRAGGILGYPTETVYGLGCVLQPEPLDLLAGIKGGRAEKSFLLLVGKLDQIRHVTWNAAAHRLAETFWPGPLTLALRAEPGSFPARVVSESGTVAFRLTGHAALRRLIQALGEPITSTSANLPGQPPATNVEQVSALLAELGGVDSLILDAGALHPSAPSTLVDCSGDVPRVVREGAIPLEKIGRSLHDLQS